MASKATICLFCQIGISRKHELTKEYEWPVRSVTVKCPALNYLFIIHFYIYFRWSRRNGFILATAWVILSAITMILLAMGEYSDYSETKDFHEGKCETVSLVDNTTITNSRIETKTALNKKVRMIHPKGVYPPPPTYHPIYRWWNVSHIQRFLFPNRPSASGIDKKHCDDQKGHRA